MSHHGNEDISKIMSEFFQKKDGATNLDQYIYDNTLKSTLGATGTFPAGKLNEQDEGGIQFGIAVYEGKLIINFGEKPVSWVGLTKDEVIDLIKYLNNKVSELK